MRAPIATLVAAGWAALLGAAPGAAEEREAPSGRSFELALTEPVDSSAGAPLRARVVRVPLGPGGPAAEIEFRPDSHATGRLGERKRVGRVVVRREGARAAGTVLQSFDAFSAGDARWFLANARVLDVDFDGRPDILLLAEFGAAWARWDVWHSDPATGRFRRDVLARDFERVRAARLQFDAATRTVTATYLSPGIPFATETFAVERGRLVRTQATRRDGGIVTFH